jgi:hypothetical protein
VGEASSLYLWSHEAAAGIGALAPGARIIAILREPASFLRSFHLQVLQAHYEDQRDLARALSLEGERRRGRHLPKRSLWPQELLYSDHVRYVEQLRRYRERFDASRILVLIYDDFRDDNAATARQVLRFLGADENVPLGAGEVNPSVATRSQLADHMLHSVSHGEGRAGATVKRAASAVVPRRLRRSALGVAHRRLVSGPAPQADERLMHTLRRRFRPQVEALSDYLGRDLVALWGYDDAG